VATAGQLANGSTAWTILADGIIAKYPATSFGIDYNAIATISDISKSRMYLGRLKTLQDPFFYIPAPG
jgi:hypothetical protein